MNRIPKLSPAMIVALIALLVAISGTAVALPGRFSVHRDDLRQSSVGARAIGKMVLDVRRGVRSTDPVARDGNFTELEGEIRCPPRAPFAVDPAIGTMGPHAYEMRRLVLPNQWGGPLGYHFKILSDEGPDVGFTMTVNCLPKR